MLSSFDFTTLHNVFFGVFCTCTILLIGLFAFVFIALCLLLPSKCIEDAPCDEAGGGGGGGKKCRKDRLWEWQEKNCKKKDDEDDCEDCCESYCSQYHDKATMIAIIGRTVLMM